jgi:hypothetical protein
MIPCSLLGTYIKGKRAIFMLRADLCSEDRANEVDADLSNYKAAVKASNP